MVASSDDTDENRSITSDTPSVDLRPRVLSHEAQLQLDLLSLSFVDPAVDDKYSAQSSGSLDSRASKNSRRSKRSNTAQARKQSKQSEKPGRPSSVKKTAPSKASQFDLSVGSVVHFPPIPDSNEVWNRMFAGRRPEAEARQVDQDMVLKMEQLRQLNKMEKMRQRRSNPNANTCKSETGTDHLGNQHIAHETNSLESRGDVEQHLNVGSRGAASRKAKVRHQDLSVRTLQSESKSDESRNSSKLVVSSRKSSNGSKSGFCCESSPGHTREVPLPSQQETDANLEVSGCYAGALKFIKSAFRGSLCLPRKSVDKILTTTSSGDSRGDVQLQKCRFSKQAPLETASSQVVVPTSMTQSTSVKCTSNFPGNSFKDPTTYSSNSSSEARSAEPESHLSLLQAALSPLPKIVQTQIEAAEFEDQSMPGMLKLLSQLSDNPSSPLVIPALLQLLTLCEQNDSASSFERLGGKEVLLTMANRNGSSDSTLVRLGVGAVFSRLLSESAQDKKVVMLLLQCIVDLETCSPMARIAAPAFLTAIWMRLVAMIAKGNMMPIQLLTRSTIRRCLNLLEAAKDFKNSEDLTASQVSAFFTAGVEFLAISAKKGNDICNVLIKECAIHRILTNLASGDVHDQQRELAAVKALIGCLCSWSEAATQQLSNWVYANCDDYNATQLAIEVCMSAFTDEARPIRRKRPPNRSRFGTEPLRRKELQERAGHLSMHHFLSMTHSGHSE